MIIFLAFGVLLIHDFIRNDPIQYFGAQPRRLILVMAIAIGGGLVATGLYRLPPQWRNRLDVIAFGAGAIVLLFSQSLWDTERIFWFEGHQCPVIPRC